MPKIKKSKEEKTIKVMAVASGHNGKIEIRYYTETAQVVPEECIGKKVIRVNSFFKET